jgi:hypothetical protein
MYTRCSLCKEEGHNANKCPDLTDPLNPGFSGAGGGGGNSHDHDDDDESLTVPQFEYNKRIRTVVYKSSFFHKILYTKSVLN